jgi:transketolase
VPSYRLEVPLMLPRQARARIMPQGVKAHVRDAGAITEALERSRELDCPAAIVCQTKKGRGVSSMEGRFGFHGKPPSPEQAEEALNELEATLEQQTEALGDDRSEGEEG